MPRATPERIVPANLDGDELWRRNGEYVDADAYDAATKRVAELELALRNVVAITWDADTVREMRQRIEAVTDEVLAAEPPTE